MKKTLLLATAFMTALVSVPYTTESEMINAEAQYALELSIDTMEIPKNWMTLTSNYRVELPVRVSNNPGIESIRFLAKKADNIPDVLSATFNRNKIPFDGVGTGTWFGFKNVEVVYTMGDDVYYDANDIICYMAIYIPEDAAVGDYFSVDFAPECITQGNEFCFKKDGTWFGIENFGKLTGGGVLIVEDRPLYGTVVENNDPPAYNEPVTENYEQQQNIPASADNNTVDNNNNNNNDSNSNNENNNQNVSKSNGESENETTKTTEKKESSETVTLESAAKTTTVSETAKNMKVTSVTDTIETQTEKEVSDDTKEKTDTSSEKEKKKSYIPAFVTAGIVAAGLIIFLICKKKKNK